MKLRFIDLFGAPGGMSLGMKMAGLQPVAAQDHLGARGRKAAELSGQFRVLRRKGLAVQAGGQRGTAAAGKGRGKKCPENTTVVKPIKILN